MDAKIEESMSLWIAVYQDSTDAEDSVMLFASKRDDERAAFYSLHRAYEEQHTGAGGIRLKVSKIQEVTQVALDGFQYDVLISEGLKLL